MSQPLPHHGSSSARLSRSLSLRAKASLSQLWRPPPPKRNDTPFNFSETISQLATDAQYDTDDADNNDDDGYHIRSCSGQKRTHPYSLEQRPKWGLKRLVQKWSKSLSLEDHDTENLEFGEIAQIRTIPSTRHGNTRGRSPKTSLHGTTRRKGFGNLRWGDSSFGLSAGSRRSSEAHPTKRIGQELNVNWFEADTNPWTDFVGVLPSELTALIFSYLDPKSLTACEAVSKIWRPAASSPHVWRERFLQEHGPPKELVPGRDWKTMFEVKQALDERSSSGVLIPV